MRKPNDLVPGHLDLLVQKTVSFGTCPGGATARRIQQVPREVLQVQQGSLCPAPHWLEQPGPIKAKWAVTQTGGQATSLRAQRLDEHALKRKKHNGTAGRRQSTWLSRAYR